MTDPTTGVPQIDVNVITQPMRDARDELLAEVADLDRQATAIEEKGKDEASHEAAKILARAVETAAPLRHEIDVKKAYVRRFELLIGREEQAARDAANGSRPETGPGSTVTDMAQVER